MASAWVAEVGIAGTATLYVAEQTGVAQGLMAFSRGVGMICGPLLMSRLLGKLKLGRRSDRMKDLITMRSVGNHGSSEYDA